MSDEMNNINEIHKTKEQTAEQAFSEEIRRKLAEPGSGKPTLEEFKLMVYKDREKRRKKRSAIVACIVVACLAGYFAFDQLVPEVGADKNPKEEIVTEDGVIIEDGGYGSSDGEENVWVINDWEYVKEAKKIVSELFVPGYITAGYRFKSLTIETVSEKDHTCEYVYINDRGDVIELEQIIFDCDETALEMDNIMEKVECEKGIIYIQGSNSNKRAVIQMNNSNNIFFWGNIPNEEIVKIMENLYN